MRRVRSQFPRPAARPPATGRGRALRLAVLVGVVAGSMLVLAGPASAVVMTVDLDGAATGTVTSTPAGIDCSNTGGGAPGPVCSFDFPFFESVSLEATPDAPGAFGHWTGNAFDGTCNSGSANPCTFTSATVATVTATFDPPPDPPAVSTDPATSVRAYSVRLEATVNPDGHSITHCVFEYGRTDSYDKTVKCSPSSIGTGTSDVEVGAYVGQLDPATTYHYRVVARNAGGESYGEDQAFTTASPPADDCPNAAIRQLQRIELPHCMALEMVSPPRKEGMPAAQPSIGADGQTIRFKSRGGLADTPGLINPLGDWYVASRENEGWGTAATSTPAEYGRFGGLPGLWTADYRRWLALSATESQRVIGQMRLLAGGLGRDWLFGDLLVPLGGGFDHNVLINRVLQAVSQDFSRVFFSSGVSQVTYLEGDPVPQGTSQPNTYVAALEGSDAESLALLARDRDGKAWGGRCGATLGGPREGLSGIRTTRRQGAMSPDGRRAFFTTRPGQPASGACDSAAHKLRIMERVETPGGVEISELIANECDRVAPACSTADGDDSFEGASADRTKVFFTSSRQLTDSDLDTGTACSDLPSQSAGCDLYLYDSTLPAGERLIQVSVGDASNPTPGAGATVLSGVTAISGDGSHVYFVASGVLTGDTNPEGDSPTDGQPNLYVYQRDASHPDGRLAFIATVDPVCVGGASGGSGGGAVEPGRDCRSLYGGFWPTFLNQTAAVPFFKQDETGAEVGGDGHVLVFISSANLTADDTDDVPAADAGRASAASDIYRYDAAADTLERISKAAPGGSDNGPINVDYRMDQSLTEAYLDAADANRWVSEDGRSVVFATGEQLVAEDTDDAVTVYLWRDGQLTMLPGDATLSQSGTNRIQDNPVISRSGDQVAFGTSDSLLSDDGDIARDIYVARVDGGFSFPEPPAACAVLAGGCHGGGSDRTATDPRTDAPSGDGNATSARNSISLAALSVAQRRRAARTGLVSLRVRSREATLVIATAKGRIGGRTRHVGRASRRMKARSAAVLKLRLTRPALRQLRLTHRLRLAIQVRSPGARPRTLRVVLRRAGR